MLKCTYTLAENNGQHTSDVVFYASEEQDFQRIYFNLNFCAEFSFNPSLCLCNIP